MLCTCNNVLTMSKMIQVRNVPDSLHRTLKLRATAAGMSLSDYLLRELGEVAEKPTLEELFDRVERDDLVELDPGAVVDEIRRTREERTEQILGAAARSPSEPGR